MRSWCVVGLCALLGLCAFLLRETFLLAELAGRYELAARAAAAAAPAAPIPAPAAPAAAPEAAGDPLVYAQMALELATTKERLQAVTNLLEQRNQEAERRAAEAAAAAERRGAAMPEGVRICLLALQECLRAEGYFGPRFLRAERLVAGALEEVEMLDGDAAGIDVAFVQAARMTATLDRASGRLELRFHDGERTLGGVRTALPKDGWALVFAGVDGRTFETKLPYLLRAEGVYPEPVARPAKSPTDVDPIVRRQWLERLDRVLEDAGGQPQWRVNRFRGMQDGWFLEAELIGVDDKRHVVAGAHCRRACLEIDPASGVVSLLLQDGVLRRGAVESTISAEGYRMLLPDLTPAKARDAMFGMVVTK